MASERDMENIGVCPTKDEKHICVLLVQHHGYHQDCDGNRWEIPGIVHTAADLLKADDAKAMDNLNATKVCGQSRAEGYACTLLEGHNDWHIDQNGGRWAASAEVKATSGGEDNPFASEIIDGNANIIVDVIPANNIVVDSRFQWVLMSHAKAIAQELIDRGFKGDVVTFKVRNLKGFATSRRARLAKWLLESIS